MINRTTWSRLDDAIARFRPLARAHAAALEQIALAEISESVHQSNAIENSTLTLDDTERILAGMLPRGQRDLREVHEAANLAAVTEDRRAGDAPLSTELILRWHGMLLRGICDDVAGRFRRGDEWVRVGAHLGAHPAFAASLVEEELARYRAEDDRHPIDRIARFHCGFEVIHPFVDGNGRIGRVLIDKGLQELGLPPIIIRARTRRTDYYPMLERFARSDDHGGMTGLLAVLLLESIHKREALLAGARIIPLADWARPAGFGAASATNRAKRQTIPAFRLRDRWMIAADYR